MSALALRNIIPSEQTMGDMARRRYQHPSVQKSKSADKDKQFWFFTARVDVLKGPGDIERKEKTFFLDFCTEINKRDAEKKRDAVLSEVVNKPEVVLRSQVKFGSLIDIYLDHSENSGGQACALTSTSCMINLHIRPAFGELRLCDIDHLAVQSWLFKLAKEPATLAWNTRKKAKKHFSQIWKMALKHKYTSESNPADGTSPGMKTGVREKTLPTVQQFKGMLAALEEPFRSILMTATFTGLRISEIRAIRWSDIASRNDFLVINESRNQINGVGPTKTPASNRAIPVGHLKTAIMSLRGDAAPSDFVFDLEYHQILRRIKIAGKQVGIDYKGFGCHTLRRLNNTWFRNSGAAIETAMAQLGHTTKEMNDLYFVDSKGAEEMKRRAGLMAELYEKVMFSNPANSVGSVWDGKEKPQ